MDYQACRLTGVVFTRRSAGNRTAATLTGRGGGCVPLLLDDKQYAAISRASGREVIVEGAALVRLVDGPPETLGVSYFDRFLATGVCAGQRLVLYVTKVN